VKTRRCATQVASLEAARRKLEIQTTSVASTLVDGSQILISMAMIVLGRTN
jgi:hypothetical protein